MIKKLILKLINKSEEKTAQPTQPNVQKAVIIVNIHVHWCILLPYVVWAIIENL